MRKHGSIICKLRPSSKRTNKLCTHAHHSDRSAVAAIFANGTYFVGTPRISVHENDFSIRLAIVYDIMKPSQCGGKIIFLLNTQLIPVTQTLIS
jgi:hypothetical protein